MTFSFMSISSNRRPIISPILNPVDKAKFNIG